MSQAGELSLPLSGMQECYEPRAFRVARRIPPAMPFQRRHVEGQGARFAILAGGFMQLAQRNRKDRRLGYAGGRDSVPRAPDVRSREVSIAWRMEDDMRDHSISPLALDQPLQLAIGAVGIVERKAHGNEGQIPVPLERVEPVGRHGIAAAIVGGEDALRLVGMHVHVGCSGILRPRGPERTCRFRVKAR